MKRCLALSALLAAACVCNAGPTALWTYEKLTEDADLVVIATPTSNRDTPEKTVIPNIQRTGADGKSAPVAAVGIETRFKTLAVLKGEKGPKDFILYHLREAEAPKVPAPNAPQLLSFDLKGERRFLLFLKREADGRFTSGAGQTHPAVGVKDVGFYP